jgi:hypothetical protein
MPTEPPSPNPWTVRRSFVWRTLTLVAVVSGLGLAFWSGVEKPGVSRPYPTLDNGAPDPVSQKWADAATVSDGPDAFERRESQGQLPLQTRATSASAQDPTPVVGYSALTFHGYDCTEDCSGHEAGYEWAELHDIDDPDDCGGNSQSFIEGCQAYAEEQQSTGADDGQPTDDE